MELYANNLFFENHSMGGKTYMKRLVSVFIIVVLLFSFTSCKTPEDKVLTSLGKYDDYEFYSEGEFQDFTYYAKYYYASTNIDENEYFVKIQDSDFARINEHLDDFESWIETFKDTDASREIVVNYDFDRSIIDTEDYIYIDSEKHTWGDGYTSLVKYDVYFFDAQTLVLYYFHNNI